MPLRKRSSNETQAERRLEGVMRATVRAFAGVRGSDVRRAGARSVIGAPTREDLLRASLAFLRRDVPACAELLL